MMVRRAGGGSTSKVLMCLLMQLELVKVARVGETINIWLEQIKLTWVANISSLSCQVAEVCLSIFIISCSLP